MRTSASLSTLVALALLSSLSVAHAAERPRVAVKQPSGKNTSAIETAIVAALEDDAGAVVIQASEWRQASQKVGHDFLRIALELSLTSVIDTTVSQKGKSVRAVIKVLSGANGRVIKAWKVSAKDQDKLAALIQRGLWHELGAAIKRGIGGRREIPLTDDPDEDGAPQPVAAPPPSKIAVAAPAPLAATPEPASVEAAEPAASANASPVLARAPGARGASPLGVALELAFLTRKLTYEDDIRQALRPYSLGGAPAARLSGWWYPASHFTTGLLTHLGVGFSIDLPVGLSSTDTSGRSFPTKSMEVEGTLRGRLPFYAHEAVLLAGAGKHSYEVSSKGDADPDVPSVSYTYLRVGAEARFEIIPPLQIGAAIAFRPLLGAGEIGSAEWFGRSRAAGLDGHVSVSYEVFDGFDVVVKGEVRRYFYTLNPEPGDERVAGGALDQYIAGSVGVAWHL